MTNPTTPTEQDKELREQLQYLIDNPSSVTLEETLQLITADRKRVALEARLDELSKIEVHVDSGVWTTGEDPMMAILISERIDELKAQQEEA